MLLVDEDEVKRFYEKVVPELKEHECQILILNARKKYCPYLPRSEECLRREVIRRNGIDEFVRKVRRMSIVDNVYVSKGELIPRRAFALYIDLDPKDVVKAWITLQKEMSDLLYQLARGSDSVLVQFRKVDVRWFSCLHRSRSRKLYWLIDMDEKNDKALDDIVDIFDGNIAWVSETRGGYHIIMRANSETGELIFRHKIINEIANNYDIVIEVQKEPMTPVPGCMQGGFVVREVKF